MSLPRPRNANTVLDSAEKQYVPNISEHHMPRRPCCIKDLFGVLSGSSQVGTFAVNVFAVLISVVEFHTEVRKSDY